MNIIPFLKENFWFNFIKKNQFSKSCTCSEAIFFVAKWQSNGTESKYKVLASRDLKILCSHTQILAETNFFLRSEFLKIDIYNENLKLKFRCDYNIWHTWNSKTITFTYPD